MKKLFVTLSILAAPFMAAVSQTLVDEAVMVDHVKVTRSEGRLLVTMELNAAELKVKQNEEVSFTPIIKGENETKSLTPVYFTGRTRHYRYLRNDEQHTMLPYYYRAGKQQVVDYQVVVPYEKWMEEAELLLKDSRCGCLQELLAENEQSVASMDFKPMVFKPVYVYQAPKLEEKVREVSGSAFIDFQVGRSEILQDFRNNKVELHKIFATIDSVKNDPDVTITEVLIKGFASPDGSYAGNERLAQKRTEALMAHVQKLYDFPKHLLHTDYEAEDWKGLRSWVSASDLANKAAILALIDTENMDLDKKEYKIRVSYPSDYQYLKKEVYPALRHSDYAVAYTVRSYTNVEEAKRVMKTRPGNLSQYEFYKVAETYQQGSDEYNNVFSTMARVYPEEEIANLNAANVAMNQGELKSARTYLLKAGHSPKAEYARGLLESIEENYDLALQFLNKAREGGMVEAEEAIQQVEELKKYQ